MKEWYWVLGVGAKLAIARKPHCTTNSQLRFLLITNKLDVAAARDEPLTHNCNKLLGEKFRESNIKIYVLQS